MASSALELAFAALGLLPASVTPLAARVQVAETADSRPDRSSAPVDAHALQPDERPPARTTGTSEPSVTPPATRRPLDLDERMPLPGVVSVRSPATADPPRGGESAPLTAPASPRPAASSVGFVSVAGSVAGVFGTIGSTSDWATVDTSDGVAAHPGGAYAVAPWGYEAGGVNERYVRFSNPGPPEWLHHQRYNPTTRRFVRMQPTPEGTVQETWRDALSPSPSLIDQLNSQFGGSGWTFVSHAATNLSQSALKVKTSRAWASNDPGSALAVAPTTNLPRYAGAELQVDYAPVAATDPANIRWVQMVSTNWPSTNASAALNLSIGKEARYMDVPYPLKQGQTPFYDDGYTANGTTFFDRPFRRSVYNTPPPEGIHIANFHVHFQLFVATVDPANPKAVSLWDGIDWGFINVPDTGPPWVSP